MSFSNNFTLKIDEEQLKTDREIAATRLNQTYKRLLLCQKGSSHDPNKIWSSSCSGHNILKVWWKLVETEKGLLQQDLTRFTNGHNSGRKGLIWPQKEYDPHLIVTNIFCKFDENWLKTKEVVVATRVGQIYKGL